jgi:WD40 repeat protein
MILFQRKLFKLLVLISIILLFSACCAKTTPSPSPTITITPMSSATLTPSPTSTLIPTPYQAVLKNTPLPSIQVPITAENAHLVVQLARWATSASEANEIAFTPDGNSLMVGIESFGVQVWDIRSGRQTNNTFLDDGGLVTVLAVSPDGNYLAISNPDLVLVQLPEHRIVNLDLPWSFWYGSFGRVLLFSPDSQSLIESDDTGDIKVLDYLRLDTHSIQAHTDASTLHIPDYNKHFIDMAFTPDGGLLISGSRDGLLKFWRTSDWGLDMSFDLKHPVSNLAITSDGSTLALGFADDNHVELWNVSTLSKYVSLEHSAIVNELTFSQDGSVLATACADNLIYLWNSHSGELLAELHGHVRPVWDLAFSPDDKLLVSMGDEGTVRLWGILPSNDPTEFVLTSTAIANFLLTPTTSRTPFPTQTPNPTISIPSYINLLPLNFPLSRLTTAQLAEVRSCNLENLPTQRYPETLSIGELENYYTPQIACDWAVLSAAYLNKLNYDDPIPEQGKRAFIQAILLNPAYLFSTPPFFGYYDSFNLVSLPPIAQELITAVHIDYYWSGIGDPSSVSYQIDISSSESNPSSMDVIVIAPPEQITSNLKTEIDQAYIQDLANALTDFVPIDQQFTLDYCTDNSPDWQMTLTFQNGSQLELRTNGSNLATIGGPWQMELGGQNYLQFSYDLPRAISRLFTQLKLHFGEPWAMYCHWISILDLAYP